MLSLCQVSTPGDTSSSELSKLTTNALFTPRLSSINCIFAVYEVRGADIDEVAFATGRDTLDPKF